MKINIRAYLHLENKRLFLSMWMWVPHIKPVDMIVPLRMAHSMKIFLMEES